MSKLMISSSASRASPSTVLSHAAKKLQAGTKDLDGALNEQAT